MPDHPPFETGTLPVSELDQMSQPWNPREISPHDMTSLKRSLDFFGVVEPIVVNRRSNRIVGGHQRVKAAIELSMTDMPVVWVDLDDPSEKQLALILNRAHGDWDQEKLALVLADLDRAAADLSLTGFTEEELEGYARILQPEQEASDPPLVDAGEAMTRQGDLWVLGQHRLVCGDCTDSSVVARLMDGQKACLMNTDPPYGINYIAIRGSEKWDDIEGDVPISGPEHQEFLERAIRVGLPHLEEGTAFYLWHPMLTQGAFFAAAAAADIIIHRQIIWVKPSFILGRSGMYHWQHELCFYAWVRGSTPAWYGAKNQSTIWALGWNGAQGEDAGEQNHPTQKPCELFAIPMRNHTKEGEIVYEPFAGSGSQLLAAEQLGRRCFALEIVPAYCDVIVKRWEHFTGRKAERFTP